MVEPIWVKLGTHSYFDPKFACPSQVSSWFGLAWVSGWFEYDRVGSGLGPSWVDSCTGLVQIWSGWVGSQVADSGWLEFQVKPVWVGSWAGSSMVRSCRVGSGPGLIQISSGLGSI